MAAQHRRRARQCAHLAGAARVAAQPRTTPLSPGARARALGARATLLGAGRAALGAAADAACSEPALTGRQQAAAGRIEEVPAAALLADLGEQLLIVAGGVD